MKQKLVLLIVGLVFIISGCAVKGPAFKKLTEMPNNKGVVYFYRPSTFLGSAIQPMIYEDDENHPIIKLRRGGYYPYITNAGTHTYFAKTESKSEVSLDVKAGEEYFIQEKIGLGFVWGRPHLRLVEKTNAKIEIEKCKLQDK